MTTSETPVSEQPPEELPSTDSTAALQELAWYRRHRKLLFTTIMLFLMAFTLLVTIPLTARLIRQPEYRASAWLRVEETYVVWRSSYSDDYDPRKEFEEMEASSCNTAVAAQVGEDYSPLEIKKSKLRCNEHIVEVISSQIERLRWELQYPTRVTLLRKAEPPTIPVERDWFYFLKVEGEREPNKQPLKKKTGHRRSSVSFLAEQVQLLESPSVLKPILNRPDVAKYQPLAESPEPVRWLQDRVRVQARANSELFILTFTCEDSEYAAIIANAIAESYFRVHTHVEAQRLIRVVDLLEDERARRIVVIQQLKEQVKELQTR